MLFTGYRRANQLNNLNIGCYIFTCEDSVCQYSMYVLYKIFLIMVKGSMSSAFLEL
jgi:hypothetical protein